MSRASSSIETAGTIFLVLFLMGPSKAISLSVSSPIVGQATVISKETSKLCVARELREDVAVESGSYEPAPFSYFSCRAASGQRERLATPNLPCLPVHLRMSAGFGAIRLSRANVGDSIRPWVTGARYIKCVKCE